MDLRGILTNNSLLSCTGVDQVAVHDAERHLKWVKAQNEDSCKKNAEEKRKQSERAKEQNQAKRKAEQTGAYGQGPSKKGTASPVARTYAKVEAASSSASASVWLNNPQSSQTGSPQWCSPRSTVHWRMADMAWTLVPKGHQTRPH